MLKLIRNFFNGLALGLTETIPGVSGGTIAVILGCYFELIEAINHFAQNPRKSLKMLVPLIIGTVSGLLLFSSIINFLLTEYSFPTMMFFIGLIIGIIPHIFFKTKEKGSSLKPKEIMLVLLPFIVLLIISSLKNTSPETPEELINKIDLPFIIFIFFSGIAAAAALVVPGFSGSFVLLLIGIYPLIIYSVSSIRLFLMDSSNIFLLQNILKVLVPLAIGIIIGGLSMVRLIEKLLKNYEKVVYCIILGLLLGSIFVLFKSPIVYKSGISAVIIFFGVMTFSAGCLISFILGKNRL